MSNKHNLECPYCGSDNTEEIPNEGCYHCKSCGDDFFFEDTIREPIRHRISRICSHNDADEQYPYPCNILISQHKFCGLKPLETARVVGVFMDYEGIIYFNIDGLDGPIEFDEMWTDDLQVINVEL